MIFAFAETVTAGQKYADMISLETFTDIYELKAAVNYSGYTGVRGLTGRYQKTFGCPNVIQLEIQRKLRDFYAYSEIVKNVTIPFLSEIVTIYIV